MGQKLEKLSEKDEESFDNSDWSEQTGQTEQSETAEQDESRDQKDCSFSNPRSIGRISGISVSSPGTKHAGELTVTPARTDPQTGQPIRPLGQQQHPLNTRGEWVGGDRESHSVIPTAKKSKTVWSPQETRQTSNKKQGSGNEAVASTGTTAMEEQENGKKSDHDQCKLGPDTPTRSLRASSDLTNEEDFVMLEDEAWMSPDGENSISLEKKKKTDNLQSSIKSRVKEDISASRSDSHLPQLSRNSPQEMGIGKTSRRKSDTLSVPTDSAETQAQSPPTASFEREMGQHLAEVTGSRCQLKGVSHVGAARTETTGGEKTERRPSLNEHSKGQASTSIKKERLSTGNNGDSSEDVLDKAVLLSLQVEPGGDREMKANWEPCLEKVDPSLKEVETQDNKRHNSVGANQSHQSRFAGAVSKRARAGSLTLRTKREDSLESCKETDSQPPNPHTSEKPPLQDNPSFSLEQCNLIPCPPQPGNEGGDGKIQVASLKRESALVCFSAVITPPPVIHQLPRSSSIENETQLGISMVNSQTERDTTAASCNSKDESVSKEKPKVKGPPPPVPKKPKNPFIKLKTAQLMSTDVQRRGKDHLRSEEKVKRRHTFHFNKSPPCNTPTNLDMCLLWDERNTYTAPTNRRPLSVDLSPWEHLSLDRMDDRYGDMIDLDYCVRIAKQSPEEELQNLDMLQRRVFLERRSRFKSSPPPVAKKPQNPFASTEMLHIPEVAQDVDIQRSKPASSGQRETCPAPLSERVSAHVSNDRYGNYNNCEKVTNFGGGRDTGGDSEVGSYRPVSEMIKERNQMQRHQGRVKPEGTKAQVQMAEQSPSMKVSQMKNAFDVPKKSKERPPEVQHSPKKGKDFIYDWQISCLFLV